MQKKKLLIIVLCLCVATVAFFALNNRNNGDNKLRDHLSYLFNDRYSATPNNIISYDNSEVICSGIHDGTVKLYVHSFYGHDGSNDFVVSPRLDRCNNELDFDANPELNSVYKDGEGVIQNGDYTPWVNYFKTAKSYQLYWEDQLLKPSGIYTEYDYVGIRNESQAFDNDGKLIRSKVLRAGEKIYFEVDVSDDNNTVTTDDFLDMRLTIDYGLYPSDINVSLTDSIAYYVITDDDEVYGPFKLYSSDYLKTYIEKSSTASTKVTSYRLVSENLLTDVPSDKVIKKIKVVPYEFYPVHRGSFRMFNISLDGYLESYDNKQYVGVDDAEELIRNQIVANMIEISTFKWSVSSNQNMTLSFFDYYSTTPSVYSSDSLEVYYGIPYTTNNQATISSFVHRSEILNGYYQYKLPTKYIYDTTSTMNNSFSKGDDIGNYLYVYEKNASKDSIESRASELASHDYISNKDGYLVGLDCGSSVNYSTSKELPIIDNLFNSGDYFTSSKYKIVGNIEFNNGELETFLRSGDNPVLTENDQITSLNLDQWYTALIAEKYPDSQVIYDSYALAKPGDALAKRGHARLVTGYSHVECVDGGIATENYESGYCDLHGGIDPERSYVVSTDITLKYANRANTTDEHVSDIELDSYINSEYTDIESLDDIYNGSTKSNYHVNTKHKFSELYSADNGTDLNDASEGMYLIFRYKNMDKISNNLVEKPYADFVVDSEENMIDYLRTNKRLKGSISTNYLLDAIRIEINNERFYIYPDQTHVYSFYNNDSIDLEEINNKLDSLDYSSLNTIKISVKTGPQLSSIMNYMNTDIEGYFEIGSIVTKMDDNITIEPKTATYTGDYIEANEAANTSGLPISYAYYSEENCEGTELGIAPINAGNYSVKAFTTGSDEYKPTSICVSHTIEKENGVIEITDSLDMTIDNDDTLVYVYNGDGIVTCESSDETILTCSVDNDYQNIHLHVEQDITEDVILTVKASEGTNFNATSDYFVNISITSVYVPLTDILNNNNFIIEGEYVRGFTLGTSIVNLVSLFNDSEIVITSDDDIISTGTTISKGTETFVVVIKGDLTGEGKVNSGDLLFMRRHLLEDNILEGPYKEAGIIASENEIKSLDLLRLRQFLLGEYELE